MDRILVKAMVMVAVVGSAVHSQPVAAQSGAAPILQVHGRTMKADGGVATSATGGNLFVIGKAATWFVTAGSARPEEMTVCNGGITEVGTVAELLKRNSFVWQVTVLPTKYENGRETFDLEWGRYRADGGGRPATGGKSTVSLGEGERKLIDFVYGEPGTRGCRGESALVEVGAGVQEDPKLAQAILQYDMWLTHRGPGGDEQIRHFVGMGRHGTELEFAFLPLRFQVPQLVTNQTRYDVIMTVLGTLRGRLRPDGRIALSVDTTRRDGLGPRGEGPIANGGSSGVKQLDLAPSEAVEIELPPASGRSSLPAAAGVVPPPRRGPIPRATEPVTVSEGRITVEDALFFEGQRTSLVVQVRQVR